MSMKPHPRGRVPRRPGPLAPAPAAGDGGGRANVLAPSYDSSARRSPLFRELGDLLRYRDLLLVLISNLNKTRYKRSVLGVAWTLVSPLLYMIVLSIAFSQVFRSPVKHYPIYVLIGIIFWNFFAQTTVYAMNSLASGGTLIKRIYLPRSIFAVASIGNGIVNLGISLVPLVAIMVVSRHTLYPTWWMLPFATLLLAMFSLGVALVVSMLAVWFADVVEMYGVLLQALFFLTPVIYPKEILPATFAAYMDLNPLSSLLEVFRTPLVSGTLPPLRTVLGAVLLASATLLFGGWIFSRKADGFAHRL